MANSKTVLVVEDNENNLVLIGALLGAAGYRVVTARSGPELHAALPAGLPDLILMDIELPGENGLALTRRLKSGPTTAPVPVIALTAHAMAGDREKAIAAGCDGYLTKPFKAADLLRTVREALHPQDGAGPR